MPDIDLGFRPRPWQAECYRQLKRFSVLVVHRRGGKTVLAIMVLIARAVAAKSQAPRFAYVGPEKGQAKRVAWDYLKRYASVIPGLKISEVELWVEFPNGARVQLDGADDPDRMRGIYLDGVVLDELADMKPQVWGEIVRPALTDRGGWAIFIGTPKGLNLLSELFYAANGKPDWFAARYTYQDTGAVDATEIESAKRDMSQSQFAQEFMCDFAAGNEDAFISAAHIDAAVLAKPEVLPSEPLICGVDVARSLHGDESVICFRRGRDARSIPSIHIRTDDIMYLSSRVCEEATRWGAEMVFVDVTGVGGGVVDRCRQLGLTVMGVNNGSKADIPIDGEMVANKGAETWARMRAWLKDGGAIPNDPELRLQLGARKYGYNLHNQIVLEPKDKMKARGLSSPDRADSLALCFSYPVAPRPMEFDPTIRAYIRSGQQGVQTEYDPFASIK